MHKPVAIVGYAFRLPGTADADLWSLLQAGSDLVTEVPDERWSKAYFLHPDTSEPGRSITFAAGTLGDISGFDAGFFGISPREAVQMDPQQRLLLEMTWEALEHAGIRPSRLRGSHTAVYLGYSGSDYSYRRADDLSVIDATSMTGNTGSVAANRISYWFDLHGPSMAVDTACSSSLVAFHQAWQAIQLGEVDQALVAGISLHLHPMPFVGFSKASMLSPGGRCRVFDAHGDGYVRAEGGGVFLLKDLALAEADGDRILAVVAGAGSNCDGRTTSLTIPSRDAQADLLRNLYARAGIEPDQVDYIEAHGTGTAVGDPIEAASIAAALGSRRSADRPLPIGSVKSNLGHLETASGVAGLVKALLCLEHRALPPSVHFDAPNPNIPFDSWNLEVVTGNRPLAATGALVIGVNSFGFGGANGHVILRSYEPATGRTTAHAVEAVVPPVLLSAATPQALRDMAGRYAALLRGNSRLDIYRLAYNAYHRREHLRHRLVLPGKDAPALAALLDQYAAGKRPAGIADGESLGLVSAPVFVYSGNGSQWAGMGQVLLAQDASFRQQVGEVDRLFRALGGASIIDDIGRPAGEDRYELTEVAQPALFAIQVGITTLLRERGIEPAATIGHSVGEVAAAWACGALSLEQAVRVIHARSAAQGRTRGSGGMTAVALGEAETIALLDELSIAGEVAVAGVNSPRGVTVAGAVAALTRLEGCLEEREIFHRRLGLDYAFHSPAMDPIEAQILDELADLQPLSAGSFVSTVIGDFLPGAALDAEYWWRNIREPVRFKPAVEALVGRGRNLFIEIGPHPVLRNYLTDILRDQDVQGRIVETLARGDERLSRLEEIVCKVFLDAPAELWAKFFDRPAGFVDLPRYPWQHEVFWPSPSPESHDDLHRRQLHPLLGFREPHGSLAWEGRLDLRQLPFLADHRVGNSVLFPAAGFVELALAAAAQREPGVSHVIEDLEIRAPLVLEEGSTRRVRFSCDERDGRFEVLSNQRLSDEPWMHHAVGRLLSGAARTPPQRAFRVPARAYDFTAEQHYHLTACVGLDYGESFRVIDGCWRDGDCLTGRFRLPDTGDELAAYRLLPMFLDGCFQLLADYSAEDILNGDTDAHVPVRIDSLRTWHEGTLPVYVEGRLVRRSSRSALVDFDLYDAELRLVASGRGVRFKRVRLVWPHAGRHWLGYRLLPRTAVDPATPARLPDLPSLAECAAGGVDSPAVAVERARYYDEVLPLLDVMCAAYAERALRGIAPDALTLLPFDLAAQGALAGGQVALFEHLLQLLHDEEAIEHTDSGWRWVPDAGLPDPEMIWLRLLGDYPDHAAQIRLAGRAGRLLPEVLRGARDGDALVAEWLDGATVADYLRSAGALQRIDRMLDALVVDLLGRVSRGTSLRVLLALDRRSAFTAALLRRLDVAQCELTVLRNVDRRPDTVDDLLAQLPSVRSIELAFDDDPEQWALGDAAGFDLVILDHVAAQMRDIEGALRILRGRVRLGGVIALAEHQPTRWAGLVLGLAPGWWRGNARSILAGSASDEMREMLLAAGFDHPIAVFDQADVDTAPYLMLARSPDPGIGVEPAATTPATLLVVHDSGGFSATFGDALRSALQLRGCRVIPVVHGARAVDKTALLHIDTHQPESLSLLVERLREGGPPPDGVIWLAGLEPDAPRPANAEAGIVRQAKRCADIGAFLTALQAADCRADFWLVTSGAFVAQAPASSDERVAAPQVDAVVWGFGRCLVNEFADSHIRLVDLCAPHEFNTMRDALVAEILRPGADDEIVLGADARYVGRVTVTPPQQRLADPSFTAGAVEVALDFDTPGPLSGLRWETRAARRPGAGEVAIDVRAAGLNFRDVMYAMGLLSDEAVEAGFAGATLGMELSGVVSAVGPGVSGLAPGDAVIAFAPSSFATRTVTSASAVVAKPADWSFEAAATVPTTFFTVFYAFRELARLREGERVLIHGAAGGVGIAAIQLAQAMGAEVFATAGSPEKRDFVHQLGVSQVFDSRSLAFADEILERTGGEGVDVVLNSLAGEAMQRSLRLLRPFGRLLELGKRDFYENTHIGLRPLRNNISYFAIDADQLMAERPDLTGRLFREMFELFDSGVLKPLPFSRFAADDAVEAFRFMQKSQQIGKVVLTFERPPLASHDSRPRDVELVLDPQASYLVTGGTSGFGAETARWLARKGARHLVLLSRRGSAAPGVDEWVEALQRDGVEVRVFACDVADRRALADVLDQVRGTLPPLRGVVHAAMVIDDGLVRDLDAERIRRVLAPKVLGAQHLDSLTRDLPLDFFVVYSSATTVFGNPGQSSYVAANRYLEYLVERRRDEGLAGLSVSWGPIADAGYLARHEALGEALEARLGGKSLSVAEALDTLEALLAQDRSGIAVLNFDWARLRRSLPAAEAARFIELQKLAGDDDLGEIDEFRDLLLQMSDQEAVEALVELIRQDVGQILRLDAERIDPQRSVHEFGMDSLMAMELAVAVEKRLGVQLPVMLLAEGPSIARLAERVVAQLRTQPGQDSTASLVEGNVRAVASVHGVAVDDAAALADVVDSLAPRRGARQ